MEPNYYEAYDLRYRQIHQQHLQWSSETPTPIVAEILQQYPLSHEAKLLEIGCGEVLQTIVLHAAQHHVRQLRLNFHTDNACRMFFASKQQTDYAASCAQIHTPFACHVFAKVGKQHRIRRETVLCAALYQLQSVALQIFKFFRRFELYLHDVILLHIQPTVKECEKLLSIALQKPSAYIASRKSKVLNLYAENVQNNFFLHEKLPSFRGVFV